MRDIAGTGFESPGYVMDSSMLSFEDAFGMLLFVFTDDGPNSMRRAVWKI